MADGFLWKKIYWLKKNAELNVLSNCDLPNVRALGQNKKKTAQINNKTSYNPRDDNLNFSWHLCYPGGVEVEHV